MRHYALIFLFTTLSYYTSLCAHYPYHAPEILSYHRYERQGLFTADASLFYGSCKDARTADKKKVNVLGIYNTEHLQNVGKNITTSHLSPLNALILDALWHVVPTDVPYATLDFTGSFKSFDGSVALGFNFTDSFFINVVLPFYKIEVIKPVYKDTTSENASNVEWSTFLANFDSILKDAGLSLEGYSQNGVGDVKCSLGWTRNVEELGQLFALDNVIQLGVLAGSADEQDISKVFSIAPGNNKHTAFFFNFDTHIGVNEHLTISVHTEQTVFLKRVCDRRLVTAEGQNGWIKLSHDKVTEEWGNKYALGGYVTYNPIDPIGLTMGYSYCHQNKHILTPQDTTLYSSEIINSDPSLKSWSLHTLHLRCEINAAHHDYTFHPRVAFSYNRIIGSHNAFLNHTVSGNLGLSITADF